MGYWAYMTEYVTAFDGIVLYQMGDRRVETGIGITEGLPPFLS